MSAEHTPSPFAHRFDQLATYENGRTPLFLLEADYNRARACWNACDGISTERLEDLGRPLMKHLTGCDERAARMVKERDEYMRALQLLADAARDLVKHMQDTGRLRLCFNLPALSNANAFLAKSREAATQAAAAAGAEVGV